MDDAPEMPEHPHVDPKACGQWELLEARFEGAATHAALFPNRGVFAYGGSSLDVDAFSNPPPAEVLDLETMQIRPLAMQGVDGDLWCGGHTFLPDGKLLFAGGTSAYPPTPDPFYGGLRQAYTFDPFSETWTRLEDMREGRWYPTLIRLADNSVLAISGLQYRHPDEGGKQSTLKVLFQVIFRFRERLVPVQEVFHLESGHWEVMADQRVFPLYPRLHLLPDGDVFYSGVFNTHYFTPGKYPSARWDHRTGIWSELGGRHHHKSREEGISLLLALRPPYYRPRVLIAGGGQHNLPRMVQSILHSLGLDRWAAMLSRFATAEATVERIDLGDDPPRWQPASSMHFRRIHANGVLLPNGQVAVIGGMEGHGRGDPEHNVDYPVLPAELYNPETDTWTVMATPQRPRVYHSTALLLPDGRVLSLGGNPQKRVIEHGVEIFSPPYLFHGERPVMTETPEQLGYATPFTLKVGNARQIAQVVLMRPQALTHVTDTDQRLLELGFRPLDDEKLEVQGPPSAGHMPQGYNLLYVLDQDGVPSRGEFVKLA